jgi:hypothetical protein
VAEIGETLGDGAQETPVDRPPTKRRTFEFILPRGFVVRRALTATADMYSGRYRLRRITILMGILAAAGIAALAVFGWEGVFSAVAGVGIAAYFLVVLPSRYFAAFARTDSKRLRPGVKYVAIYGMKSFAVRLPFGEVREYRYAQIKDVHARGAFVFFALPEERAREILPLALIPKGDVSWLQVRAGDAAAPRTSD